MPPSIHTGKGDLESFPREWTAEILAAARLIAPARQFVYPRAVPGEEDALARGALQMLVHPAAGTGGAFLATCALGFRDPAMPTGLWSCPNPREVCAVAGGYAYLIDTASPDRSTQIPLRPVAQVVVVPKHALLVFVGFHSIAAWTLHGLAWQSARLSWEGIRITKTDGDSLHGFGWDMRTDRESEFILDLRTGAHSGGAF